MGASGGETRCDASGGGRGVLVGGGHASGPAEGLEQHPWCRRGAPSAVRSRERPTASRAWTSTPRSPPASGRRERSTRPPVPLGPPVAARLARPPVQARSGSARRRGRAVGGGWWRAGRLDGLIGRGEPGRSLVAVPREDQVALGTCHGHVEEPALLVDGTRRTGTGVRDQPGHGADDDHGGPFQALGGVERGQGHGVVVGALDRADRLRAHRSSAKPEGPRRKLPDPAAEGPRRPRGRPRAADRRQSVVVEPGPERAPARSSGRPRRAARTPPHPHRLSPGYGRGCRRSSHASGHRLQLGVGAGEDGDGPHRPPGGRASRASAGIAAASAPASRKRRRGAARRRGGWRPERRRSRPSGRRDQLTIWGLLRWLCPRCTTVRRRGGPRSPPASARRHRSSRRWPAADRRRRRGRPPTQPRAEQRCCSGLTSWNSSTNRCRKRQRTGGGVRRGRV